MPALLRIERPAPDEHAPVFSRYIERISGDDAFEALTRQIGPTLALVQGLTDARALHRYAPGKWSVKETIVHLADAERVFSYRAMRFARKDHTELAGFDENRWVPESGSDERPIAEIADEYRAVRAATLALFRSFAPDVLLRRGVANGHSMSVRAAAWCIAGHELHHGALLRERYGLGA